MTTAPQQQSTSQDSQIVSPAERIQVESIIIDLAKTPQNITVGEIEDDDPIVEAMQSHQPGIGSERHAEMPSDAQLLAKRHVEPALEQPQQLPATTNAAETPEEKNISRNELVEILENFVRLVKTGEPGADLSFAPGREGFSIKDKTEETVELRCMLVQAQETIIRLLTDRVDDKAKIATLEAQMRLLPDLQQQADRALAVAVNQDDVKTELKSVKLEIERMKLAKIRTEIETRNHHWWGRFSSWMLQHDNGEKTDV